MDRVKRNTASTCAKYTDSDSFCAYVKYHSDLCSPFIHSVISNDSVNRKGRPWSDCANAQADLGFHCPQCPKTRFRIVRAIHPFRHECFYYYYYCCCCCCRTCVSMGDIGVQRFPSVLLFICSSVYLRPSQRPPKMNSTNLKFVCVCVCLLQKKITKPLTSHSALCQHL